MRAPSVVLVAAAVMACGGSSTTQKTGAADSAPTAPAADTAPTPMPAPAVVDTSPASPAAPVEAGKGTATPVSETFAPELKIDPAKLRKLPSGLRLVDVAAGTGAEATAGHEVTVHYTGWLTDGKQFDSSRDRSEPFTFNLGAGEVIKGWDEGVAGMKVGGRRKLVIPADLGYGEDGSPPDIPGGATLVFDVELIKVR